MAQGVSASLIKKTDINPFVVKMKEGGEAKATEDPRYKERGNTVPGRVLKIRDHDNAVALAQSIYDFADPDSSVFVTSTGQSGHFLSRHYEDLGQLWRRGEYIPMSLDEELARAAAVGVTTLVPATP